MKFIWNWDKQSEPVYETTLAELQKLDPDVVAKDVFAPEWGENGGLAPNSEDYLWVEFEFEDKGDQNIFQGDSLNLEWTFNASQGEGETKSGYPRFFKEKEVLDVSTSFYLLFLILLPFCKFKKFTKLFFGDAGAHRIFNELCPFGV